ASLVSVAYRYAPCSFVPVFFRRYLAGASLVRYVCGVWSLVAQSSWGGFTGNATGEQLCVIPTVNPGMSGSPVAAPDWSWQATSSWTLVTNTIALPTMAKSF